MMIIVLEMNKEPYIIPVETIGDEESGFLTVADDNLPFKPNRVYWIYNTPKHVKRGGHSQFENDTIVTCVKGAVEIFVQNTKGVQYYFLLDNPEKTLFIPSNHWKEFVMTSDAVLLCLASHPYNENDYIRSKEEFFKING